MKTTRLLFTFLCLSFFACSTKANDTSKHYINYHLKATAIIDSLKLDKKKIYIQIDKSSYTLSLKVGETVIKSYPVVLGFNPVDDKMKEGDGCTPEGTFKIRSQYPHKSWSKFIWIDYPNDESRKKFAERKRKGLIPKNAKIGGEIGIHGVPAGYDKAIDNKQNWTLGCISLKNKDVNEIYSLVKAGTKIVINH